MITTTTDPWSKYWATVGNEEWLAARQLLEISPRVLGYYACFLDEILLPRFDDAGNALDTFHRDLQLDWEAAAIGIDGEGLSSTERRLACLVAALTTGRPFHLEDLTRMGSWSADIWQTLVAWGTDGHASLQAAS